MFARTARAADRIVSIPIRIRHIADQIVWCQSLVVEKCSIHKKYSGHTKLPAQRRGHLHYRCIGIIERHEVLHGGGRPLPSASVRTSCEAHGSVVRGQESEAQLRISQGSCSHSSRCVNGDSVVRDIVKHHTSQRVGRPEHARNPETIGRVPERFRGQVRDRSAEIY